MCYDSIIIPYSQIVFHLMRLGNDLKSLDKANNSEKTLLSDKLHVLIQTGVKLFLHDVAMRFVEREDNKR